MPITAAGSALAAVMLVAGAALLGILVRIYTMASWRISYGRGDIALACLCTAVLIVTAALFLWIKPAGS